MGRTQSHRHEPNRQAHPGGNARQTMCFNNLLDACAAAFCFFLIESFDVVVIPSHVHVVVHLTCAAIIWGDNAASASMMLTRHSLSECHRHRPVRLCGARHKFHLLRSFQFISLKATSQRSTGQTVVICSELSTLHSEARMSNSNIVVLWNTTCGAQIQLVIDIS